MSDDEARAIAAQLTPLQREAFATIPGDGTEHRPTDRRLFDALRLCCTWGIVARCDGRGRGFVILPRGLRVRAHLAECEARQ